MADVALEPQPSRNTLDLQIDTETFTVAAPGTRLTGRHLLSMAGKDPGTHSLVRIHPGLESVIIDPDEVVDLAEAAMARFSAVAKAGPFKTAVPAPQGTGDARTQAINQRLTQFRETMALIHSIPDYRSEAELGPLPDNVRELAYEEVPGE